MKCESTETPLRFHSIQYVDITVSEVYVQTLFTVNSITQRRHKIYVKVLPGVSRGQAGHHCIVQLQRMTEEVFRVLLAEVRQSSMTTVVSYNPAPSFFQQQEGGKGGHITKPLITLSSTTTHLIIPHPVAPPPHRPILITRPQPPKHNSPYKLPPLR